MDRIIHYGIVTTGIVSFGVIIMFLITHFIGLDMTSQEGYFWILGIFGVAFFTLIGLKVSQITD
jgi:hypothetical protein